MLARLGPAFKECPAGRVTLSGDRVVGTNRTFEVDITRPVSISTTVITQGMWTAVMSTTPWIDQATAQPRGDVRIGDDYPAVWVSWNDAMLFCGALQTLMSQTVGLPTESQWEYAYRAGTSTTFYWGDDPKIAPDRAVGTHFDRTTMKTCRPGMMPVSTMPPNPRGLYDMAALVSEWVADRYPINDDSPFIRAGAYPYETTVQDWMGREGDQHMIRKGCFRMRRGARLRPSSASVTRTTPMMTSDSG